MPPSLVQWGSSAGYDIQGGLDPTLHTATFETNPAEGNLLVLAISVNTLFTPEITFTKPDGWTQLATWDCQQNYGEMGWYYRFATSEEGSKVEIYDAGADNETYVMFITDWSGVDGDDPFHDGATFTGSQFTDLVNEYTTEPTLSGTREMLYLAWGQWEMAEMTTNMATIGSMFATTLNGHYNNDRFIQAELVATNIRSAAANWSWTGDAVWGNAAIIGFSGSHQGTVWVPPLMRTRRGIFGGVFQGINRGIL